MMSMTCSKHVKNYKYIEGNLCIKLDNYQESLSSGIGVTKSRRMRCVQGFSWENSRKETTLEILE